MVFQSRTIYSSRRSLKIYTRTLNINDNWKGITPFEANMNAVQCKEEAKLLDKKAEFLRKRYILYILNSVSSQDFVQIMHIDIDGSTKLVPNYHHTKLHL